MLRRFFSRYSNRAQSAQLQSLLALFAPLLDQVVEFDWAAAVQRADESRATFLNVTLVVVVTGSAGIQVALVVERLILDGLHPCGFRFRRRLQRARLIRPRMLDDIGDVGRLLLEHVREVRRQSILR